MEARTRQARDVALGPYLSILGKLSEHLEEGSRVSTIHVGDRTVEVEPWERVQVLGALNEPSEDDDLAWRRILADGVAYRTRCIVDLGEVGDPGKQDTTASERLRMDIALGVSLMEESQQAINLLVLGGKLDEAKNLTRFRHKIKRTLDDLKGHVDGDDARSTEKPVPEPEPEVALRVAHEDRVTEPRERSVSRKAVPEFATETEPVAVGAPRKRRWVTPLLLVILILCGAAWAGLHFGWLNLDWIDPGWIPRWGR